MRVLSRSHFDVTYRERVLIGTFREGPRDTFYGHEEGAEVGYLFKSNAKDENAAITNFDFNRVDLRIW
jgi:hypothetical protein